MSHRNGRKSPTATRVGSPSPVDPWGYLDTLRLSSIRTQERYKKAVADENSACAAVTQKNDVLAAQRAASEAQNALIEKTKQEIAAKRKAMSDARADKAKKVREVEEATRKECKEILCREMAMARRE